MKYTFFFLLIFLSELNSQDLTPFQSNELWGFKDSSGVEIIPAQYEHIAKFYKGFATVWIDGKQGAINTKNELVIPAKYEYIRYYGDDRFCIGYRKKYLGEYDQGIIDTMGNVIIEPKFHFIQAAKKAYKVTKQTYKVVGESQGMDRRETFNKFGLFSHNGELLLPPEYEQINFLNDSIFKATKNDTTALFHISGKQLTGFVYKRIGTINEDLIKVTRGDKSGYLDLKGKEVIPCKYESCGIFINDIARVKKDGKTSLINSKEEIIFDFIHKGLGLPYQNQLVAYNLTENDKRKWGLINMTGEEILGFNYEKCSSEYQGITAFAKNNKWKIYDYENQKLFDSEFDEITVLERNEFSIYQKLKEKRYTQSIALVRIGNKWGLINEKGNILIEVEHEKQQVYLQLSPFHKPNPKYKCK